MYCLFSFPSQQRHKPHTQQRAIFNFCFRLELNRGLFLLLLLTKTLQPYLLDRQATEYIKQALLNFYLINPEMEKECANDDIIYNK